MTFEFESMPLFDWRSRQTRIRDFADRHGIPFERKISFRELPAAVRSFRLFRYKSSRRIRNILSLPGPDPSGHIRLFDFMYTDGDCDTKRTTIFLFESDLLELPVFRVRPKNVLFKFGELFVDTDNAFQEYPLFVENCRVTGYNMDAVKYAIKPEVLHFLGEKRILSMEGAGNSLIIYRKNKTQKTPVLMDFYQECLDVCRWMIYSDSNDYV